MKTMRPYQPNTIPFMLHSRAVYAPDRIAYSFPELGQNYSWSRVWQEVQLLAKGFLALGVRKGDRIAMLMQGRMELIMSMYAAASIGAVSAPLNTYSRKAELQGCLEDARPTVLIMGTGGHQLDYPSIMREIEDEALSLEPDGGWIPSYLFVLNNERSHSSRYVHFHPFTDLFDLAAHIDDPTLHTALHSLDARDPVVLLFTSGTLGSPKGVLRSTASFLQSAEDLSAHPQGKPSFAQRINDRIAKHYPMMTLLPLYHMGGFGTLLSNLFVSNMRIVMLTHYNPVNALAALAGERCRMLSGTPFMIRQLLASPERGRYDLTSVLGVIFTSAAVNHVLINKAAEELQLMFFMVTYGSSEAGTVANGICFVNRRKNMFLSLLFQSFEVMKLLGGHIPFERFEQNSYSLAGKVEKSVAVKIVNPHNGEPMSPNEQGEIFIQSPRVMKYMKESSNRERFTADGWYKSGDLGFVDEEGHLTITGRLHRIISRGGEKISPVEIENALLKHKAVEDALVLGIPDELYGEQVCACIIPKSGENPLPEQLTRDLAPSLSAFKLPRYYVFLPAFPLSPTGKVSVVQIRQLALEQIGGLRKNA